MMRQWRHSRVLASVSLSVFLHLLVAPASQAVDLIGYVPYYRMSGSYNTTTLPAQLAMLDEIRYFGLTAANNGLVTPLAGSGTLATHFNRIATIKQAIEAIPVSH